MKNMLMRWLSAIRTFFLKRLHSVGRFFYTRPALKRGAFAFGLFAVIGLPVAAVGVPMLSGLWAVALLALFLGLGAERASLEWDPVFALPPVRNFAFWRWHGLEKKRFTAVIVALGIGLLLSLGGAV